MDKLYNGYGKGPEETTAFPENYVVPSTLQWLLFHVSAYLTLSAKLFIKNNIILGSSNMYVVAYSLCPLNGYIYLVTTCASSKDNSPIRKKSIILPPLCTYNAE